MRVPIKKVFYDCCMRALFTMRRIAPILAYVSLSLIYRILKYSNSVSAEND